MQFWFGLWLLSGSWLFGVSYFFQAQPAVWAVLVSLGTALISLHQAQAGTLPAQPAQALGPGAPATSADNTLQRSPQRGHALAAIGTAAVLLPAIVLLPWPHRVGPLLVAAGSLLSVAPQGNCLWRGLAGGMRLSGSIVLAQTLALLAYTHWTAREHDLPPVTAQLLAGLVRWLGIEAGADGADLVLPTMRANHHLGVTWELVFDPGTVCFVVGGIAALVVAGLRRVGADVPQSKPDASTPMGSNKLRNAAGLAKGGKALAQPATAKKLRWCTASPAWRAVGWLLVAAAVWVPVRLGLEVGLFLHRALRTEYEEPLNLMNQFWSPWPRLLWLLPLAALAGYWVRTCGRTELAAVHPVLPLTGRLALGGAALGLGGAAVATLAVLWDPIGQPKAGRVAVDEFHSTWEPTGRPFDTEWYGHLSGYNYACLYDFCSRYYTMSRLTNALTDVALANLDVLILKVPTEPFAPEEVDAIERFVRRGGGLLLIGEHTDVFNTSFHLNAVARRFGFQFRYDCLFGMESFFDQAYSPARWRHPVLQHVPPFDFATSCSIVPARRPGRGVIVATGLKNSMADYHAPNYYPQAVDHAAMRAGAFIQLWATRYGRGRVLAFTDSTIFSNFSTFEPGKIELFMGMIEWLNRQDRLGNLRLWLWLLAAGLGVCAARAGWRTAGTRHWLVVGGLVGWTLSAEGLMAWQRYSLPPPKPVRPLTWVTIDRTICDGPLSKGGFIGGKPDGFGIFERWILRLGYFTRRRAGLEALEGDLVVFFYPRKPVPTRFQQAVSRYVQQGGKVLVLDSPQNTNSTAAALLAPFQLALRAWPGATGVISGPAEWPAVPVEAAHEIGGGQPLFWLGNRPVGAVARYGQGIVVVLGFASRFADPQMGMTGDVVPDTQLRKVFDLQFALLRAIIENRLPSKTRPATDGAPASGAKPG